MRRCTHVNVYQSQAAEEKRLIATGNGVAQSVVVTNLAASTRYLFAFDATTATGTRLLPPVAVAPGDTVSLDFDGLPLEFATGLYLAASTTQGSYTGSGTADLDLNVEYSVPGGRVTRRADLAPQRRA